MMRLFVGIPLTDAVVAQLAMVRNRLRSAGDGLRWPPPDSWHITLQFLGNAGAEQLPSLQARLAGVRSPPVPVKLGGLGIFDRAGIFFAAVELTAELAALEKRVTAATSLCGFAAEKRPYQPHITLARSSGAGGKRQLKALKTHVPDRIACPPFVAREFLLYESHLGAGGSKYEVLAGFLLSASAS